MSMRLDLAGFKLAKLRKILGGGEAAVVSALEAKLAREAKRRSAWGLDRPQFAEAFGAALRRAVESGAPFDDLDREEPVHAVLADWLVARSGRRAASDGDFKYLPLMDLLGAAEASDHGLREKLGHLLEGRPLFGRRLPEAPIYGYLSRREASEVCRRLEALADGGDGDPDAAEMAADLAEQLGEIVEESLDVWAFIA